MNDQCCQKRVHSGTRNAINMIPAVGKIPCWSEGNARRHYNHCQYVPHEWCMVCHFVDRLCMFWGNNCAWCFWGDKWTQYVSQKGYDLWCAITVNAAEYNSATVVCCNPLQPFWPISSQEDRDILSRVHTMRMYACWLWRHLTMGK